MRLLQANEWGERPAKRMGMYTYSLEDPGAKHVDMASIVQEVGHGDINPEKVCILGKARDGPTGMAGVVQNACQKLGDNIKNDIGDAEKQLNQKRGRAAVGRFEPVATDIQDMKPSPIDIELATDLGASPWLLTPQGHHVEVRNWRAPIAGHAGHLFRPRLQYSLGHLRYLCDDQHGLGRVGLGELLGHAKRRLLFEGTQRHHNVERSRRRLRAKQYFALPGYIMHKEDEPNAPFGSFLVWTIFAPGLGVAIEDNAWRALAVLLGTVSQNKVDCSRAAFMSKYIPGADKTRAT